MKQNVVYEYSDEDVRTVRTIGLDSGNRFTVDSAMLSLALFKNLCQDKGKSLYDIGLDDVVLAVTGRDIDSWKLKGSRVNTGERR
jgi:hypothetical protein